MVLLLLIVCEVVLATSDYCQWSPRHTLCGYQVRRHYQRGDCHGVAGSWTCLWLSAAGERSDARGEGGDPPDPQQAEGQDSLGEGEERTAWASASRGQHEADGE